MVKARCSFASQGAPNKSFEPTANSAAFIRETWMIVGLCARRLDSSVRRKLNGAPSMQNTLQRREFFLGYCLSERVASRRFIVSANFNT
jgi:hypothetical protein